MTISNIVSELLASGMIIEKDNIDNGKQGVGRKQMCLTFSENTPVAIGIWLSRDFCEGVIVNMNLQEIARYQINFSKSETQSSITEKLVKLIKQLIETTNKKIIGIGISSIGPLDSETGVILNPPNFFGITDYTVVSLLEEQTGLPVFLQNDMNAAALAEKYFGLSKEEGNFGYIGITNGLGSGIVIDHRLFEGARGFSGEIGHMVIDRHGKPCHCGNHGCLETMISVPIILQRFQKAFQRDFQTLEEVCLFCENNASANKLMIELYEVLSIGLINFCNMFDPSLIILGHEGASFTEKQRMEIAKRVNQGILGNRVAIEFKKSFFGTLAPLYGAAVVVLEQVFEGKLLYKEFFGITEEK